MEAKKQAKRPWRGSRWVLTVHGQHPRDLDNLKEFFDSDRVRAACLSREFGRTKTVPHWQAYYELVVPTSSALLQLNEILGHNDFHVEKAIGTKKQCVAYVFATRSSRKVYEIGSVLYRKNVEDPWDYDPRVGEYWENFRLRPFQEDILEIADRTWDDRSIYWIYDHGGNTGKTVLAKYLHIYRGAIVTGGTASNMKHAISRWQEIAGHNPAIIIADVARSDSFTKTSAKGIESIKNGIFFDGKYESGMVFMREQPQVFIFANFSPDRSMLSMDRWKVFRIDEDNFELIEQKY